MSIITMPNLIENVARQLGYSGVLSERQEENLYSTFLDVVFHGSSWGVPGFTYLRDTVKFYAQNADAIWELLNDDADDMGITPIQLIASFTESHSITDQTTLANLLAWYALERVAEHVDSARKEQE